MVEDAATVVIVSHNLNYLKQVCDRMMVMEDGELIFTGQPEDAINEYRRRIKR
jgi:ABC-type polysaccharide/polyol phosphate transport system ATPase subunit